MRASGSILCVVAIACQLPQSGEVDVEANELGITRLEIGHRSQNADRLLTLRGFDAADQEVARATLRTGMVLYGADVAEDWNPGTELTITVGELTRSFVSPDRKPHGVQNPDDASLVSFVHLRGVADAIEAEAGITFPNATGDSEIAFTAGACAGANFPVAKGNPSQCCKDGVQIWHKIASGASANKLANRVVQSSGLACRNSDGTIGCTDAACYFGPCGAAINTVPDPNTTAAVVFTPVSFPTQCGRDSNGSSSGGGVQAPEAYTSQALKAGVTASCPYTACKSDGSAGIHLTLRATCVGTDFAATGTVAWNGTSIRCSGFSDSQSVDVWYPYNTQGTVTHGPSPNWVQWIAGCTGTGTCVVTPTSDMVVEGYFENDTQQMCQPGTC